MLKAKWIGQFTMGMLLSMAAMADEAQQPAGTATVETLLAESAYAPRWQLDRPIDITRYASTWRQPIADVDFQDNSVLGRVSKLRNLSLLTLAESRQTRLFLGVNDDGLVGLHFVVVPKYGDERYLSLMRMPYLKKDGKDTH